MILQLYIIFLSTPFLSLSLSSKLSFIYSLISTLNKLTTAQQQHHYPQWHRKDNKLIVSKKIIKRALNQIRFQKTSNLFRNVLLSTCDSKLQRKWALHVRCHNEGILRKFQFEPTVSHDTKQKNIWGKRKAFLKTTGDALVVIRC